MFFDVDFDDKELGKFNASICGILGPTCFQNDIPEVKLVVILEFSYDSNYAVKYMIDESCKEEFHSSLFFLSCFLYLLLINEPRNDLFLCKYR